MQDTVKIIIADDNLGFCDFLKKFLEKYDDIEILGIAYTDQEEIELIEKVKPEIVITDLMRNHKYTGLEIIVNCLKNENHSEFLVISADNKEDVIKNDLKIGGYIKKPFFDYNVIVEELRKIKKKINL